MAVPPVVTAWVDEVAQLTTPDSIVYCDGTEPERDRLVAECLATGELIELNQARLPGCYLHRSAPHDVARTEHLTFVCTDRADDVGPNNNWMAPADAQRQADAALRRRDAGPHAVRRPLPHGPAGLALRQGRRRDHRQPLRRAEHADHDAHGHGRPRPPGDRPDDFTRCLHSLGDLSPDRRFIMHFPDENTVWSVGSGYGGNALLGKKCLALRLASWLARDGGLARRAHADPRPREPGRARALRHRRVSVGVRQDQPGDAGAARQRCPAGRRGRSATTSPGCGRAPTAGCGRSTRRTASSASCRAPAARPTRTRSR